MFLSIYAFNTRYSKGHETKLSSYNFSQKSNVCFLGEVMARQSRFEINWPLEMCRNKENLMLFSKNAFALIFANFACTN